MTVMPATVGSFYGELREAPAKPGLYAKVWKHLW